MWVDEAASSSTVVLCVPELLRPCLGQATLFGVLYGPLCRDTLDAIDTPTNARAPLAKRDDPLLACESPSWRTVPFFGKLSKSTHDHAELDCQGSSCSAREDSCLMFRRELVSRDTGGRDMRDMTKREGETRGAIMLDVRSTRSAQGRSRTLVLVRVMLASQVACARKRKRIRRAPLDDAAVAILDATNGAILGALMTLGARVRQGADLAMNDERRRGCRRGTRHGGERAREARAGLYAENDFSRTSFREGRHFPCRTRSSLEKCSLRVGCSLRREHPLRVMHFVDKSTRSAPSLTLAKMVDACSTTKKYDKCLA